MARLLRDTPPALHGAILDAASTGKARFTLIREPLVDGTGTGERTAFIARGLSVALDVGRERVRVAPQHDDTPGGFWAWDGDDHDEDHHHGHEDWRDHWFAASVATGDGRWLNVAVGPLPSAPPWGRTFLLSFLYRSWAWPA